MTNSKIKNIIMVVAIILCLALAGGWIAQTVVIKEQNKKTSVTETDGCFVVTPENTENGIMTLSAELYATEATEDINAQAAAFFTGETYTLTANVSSLKGNNAVDWSAAFIDTTTQYATGNSVTNYIVIEQDETDTHTVRLRCLQPFMEQIVVKACIRNSPDKYVTCVCDYEQRYVYSIELGDYTFRSDGVAVYTDGKKIPLVNAKYKMDFTQSISMDYAVIEKSTLYTKTSTQYKADSNDINFIIQPTAEIEAMLDSYGLTTYTGNGNGTFGNFFDIVWAHAENGDYGLIEDLAGMTNNKPFYQLKITNTPSGEVIFDLYFDFIMPDDFISINKNQVTF
jgi:Fe-S cluster assembly iron-binding protein IscA